MTNAEKFKTPQDRAEAFDLFCQGHQGTCIEREVCADCPIFGTMDDCESASSCEFAWLELEASDEFLTCFYCKHQSVNITKQENGYVAKCDCCDYTSMAYDSVRDAIAAHNRVAMAVREVK